MTDRAVPPAGPLVTGSEIARLAGVTRAAVSNWRRRHEGFPTPAGGSTNSPLYALAEVQEWLEKQRKGQGISPEVELWQALRAAHGEHMVAGVVAVAEVLAGGSPGDLTADVARPLRALLAAEPPAAVLDALVERLVDSVGRSGSDQVTPPRVVRAVRHVVGDLPPDATVLDPACGVGALLLAVAGPTPARCRGQDVDPDSARLAQLRAQLQGRPDVRVVAGDSLLEDQLPDVQADLTVCDPPAGVTEWGREALLLDARWEFGTPSKAEGELAWLQHAYARTAPGGRVVMVMPASAAYRKAGRRIRAELVRRGVLREVVALAPGTATSHAQPVHLWCLRRPETPTAAGPDATLRMVDLTGNAPDGPLEPRPDQVADVPLMELLDDSVDLTPGTRLRGRHTDYPGEYAALRAELAAALERLAVLLPSLAAGDGAGTLDGTTTSVAELARAGLVSFEGDLPVSTSDQLDTDYLQGVVHSAVNTRRSTSQSGSYRLDARGARVPRMGLDDQQRYGAVFRGLADYERTLSNVRELSSRLAELARDGLGSGALAPEQ